MRNSSGNRWDVVVVGGGSAGLSAALMLVRARRRVLVLDGAQPRNGVAPHMHGVLSRDGYSPLQLLEDGRAEIGRYGGVISRDTVTEASTDGIGFTITTRSGDRLAARRLLVATGLRDELPALEGLHQQWGTGAVVCPYCDGWEVRDRRIGVLASGADSVHKAQLLRQWTADLVYLTGGEHRPSDADARALTARGIAIEERALARVVAADGALQGVETVDGELIRLDSLFLNPRFVPSDALLVALGAERFEQFGGRWVQVDPTGRTTVPGLWAAGNVVNPGAGVPVAMGAGAMAGAAINADLTSEDVRIAVDSALAQQG